MAEGAANIWNLQFTGHDLDEATLYLRLVLLRRHRRPADQGRPPRDRLSQRHLRRAGRGDRAALAGRHAPARDPRRLGRRRPLPRRLRPDAATRRPHRPTLQLLAAASTASTTPPPATPAAGTAPPPRSASRPASRSPAKAPWNWRQRPKSRSICPAAVASSIPAPADPELVAADVRNGIVSAEAAARDYGVVVDDDYSAHRPERTHPASTEPAR